MNYLELIKLQPEHKVFHQLLQMLLLDLLQYQLLKRYIDKVRIRLISQQISGISRFLRKFFRCCNGTISTIFVPSFPVYAVIFSLNLKYYYIINIIITIIVIINIAGNIIITIIPIVVHIINIIIIDNIVFIF